MGSNHRLVLFTHALCQLSYPAVDRSVASRSSGTPGGPSLACAPMRRKQITTRQQRPSRHTVSSKESSLGVVRIAPSRVVRGCYRRSRARRAANQGGHRRTRWKRSLLSSGRLMGKPSASHIQLRMRHCTRPKSSCASMGAVWRSLYIWMMRYLRRLPSGSIKSGCGNGVLPGSQPSESSARGPGVHGWPFKADMMYCAAATAAVANAREKASCLSAIMAVAGR
jgi:hypothetical protein